MGADFNPRTPCGVRHGKKQGGQQACPISIHAPARGATCILRHERKRNKFQSTHPRGVRRTDDPLPTVTTGFQSTHPRGVRHAHDAQSVEVLHISIHAPARGATQGDARAVPCPDDFNPRTREGCDLTLICSAASLRISIHAPARGATCLIPRLCRASRFQSTHPRGVRLSIAEEIGAEGTISIHAPARGATSQREISTEEGAFQSTHPRGVRPLTSSIHTTARTFQSTHPRGVRQRVGVQSPHR